MPSIADTDIQLPGSKQGWPSILKKQIARVFFCGARVRSQTLRMCPVPITQTLTAKMYDDVWCSKVFWPGTLSVRPSHNYLHISGWYQLHRDHLKFLRYRGSHCELLFWAFCREVRLRYAICGSFDSTLARYREIKDAREVSSWRRVSKTCLSAVDGTLVRICWSLNSLNSPTLDEKCYVWRPLVQGISEIPQKAVSNSHRGMRININFDVRRIRLMI